MGLEPEMIERLCKIAHQVDYGNVESFGFKLDMDPGLGRVKSAAPWWSAKMNDV
jgi:hypothetical protein